MSYNLDDYVDVKERLRLFYAKFPEGSVQFELVDMREIAGKTVLVGRAYAYRTPDDTRPGIGTAWELVPGLTPYTRGSELMNLETSCWGRAVGSLGIGLDRGIATAQEVMFAQARQEKPAQRSTGRVPHSEDWETAPPPLPPSDGVPERTGAARVSEARREMGSYHTPSGRTIARGDDAATEKQLTTLGKMLAPLGYETLEQFLEVDAELMLGRPATEADLTKAEASAIFDAIKAYRSETKK